MARAKAVDVVATLEALGATVATCESITGGLICGELTSVPGSSRVVRGGLITYATDLKTRLADVDPALIERHGVVSPEVAHAMARGVRRACQADWGLAVTGVAGPGPSDGVAAGTVWLCVEGPGAGATVLAQDAGDRQQVRRLVVDQALDLLASLLADAGQENR
ncbi:MAG: CinA family protein [Propionibacteriaceae bacterium]|jgi:nicotinamide-nucleotide amidase|nr:CinA family protein [Propionibacteriaceae bacterium]